MSDQITAGTISIEGAGKDPIEAYLAAPDDTQPRGGVVVIHHMPGYDRATKEMTVRFATMGYYAICPNLYSREAPGASPDDAAARARSLGGVPDDRLVGDVAGAVAHLRSLPNANGKVGVIGHCSGGRQAFLAATHLPLDAAIDCYGAFVVAAAPPGMPWKVGPIAERAATLNCPLLGLFGIEDKNPSPDEVEELAEALREAGKQFEFHLFPDAGHAFFAPDRPSYRPQAAVEGWAKIEDFLDRKLSD
jgi:carboxymethylenebutenolidase